MDRMLDLNTILTVITIWVGIGVIALVAPRHTRYIALGLFPISAVLSLALAALALHGLFAPPEATTLRLGLPLPRRATGIRQVLIQQPRDVAVDHHRVSRCQEVGAIALRAAAIL